MEVITVGDDRFWLHDAGSVPPGAERYDGPAPIPLDELRRALPQGWKARRGWYVEAHRGTRNVIPTTILETRDGDGFEYFPARPLRLIEGFRTAWPEFPEGPVAYRSILRRSSWVREQNPYTSADAARAGNHRMAETLASLEANPLATPMTPDNDGWLDDGETALRFIPSRPTEKP